jgi:hypothetical protein
MWCWAYKRKSKVYKLRLAMFISIRPFHMYPVQICGKGCTEEIQGSQTSAANDHTSLKLFLNFARS